ncbi:MAG: hypothetical protein KF900_14130 [Bacteroidetes bacterium]|nr:hypothetical protein [Bacteroidota bacterium]
MRIFFIAAFLGIGALANKAKAQSNTAPQQIPRQDIVITDFDAAWDYKYSAGTWFTKRKAATEWQTMQSVASNYSLAVERLTGHLQQKGIYI